MPRRARILPLAEVNLSRREYTILALIILGAATIRIAGLTRESFWTDETFSANATLFASPREVIEYARGDVHPPGFFLALWGWAKLFGSGEFALRLFTALGGILMVPTMFRLGRQLFDVRTGLIAAFFSAFLIQSVYFSQELRTYSWLATLGALCVSLAIDCRHDGGWRSAALLTLATVALAYMHYFGMLLAVLVWIAVIAFPRARASGAVNWVGAGIFSLTFLPWVPSILAQRGRVNWIPPPDARYVTELFNVYFGPGMPVDIWVALFLAAGIPLALGRGSFRIRSAENLLLMWIVLPLLIVLLVSAFVRPVYSPRNMLIAGGAAVLLLGRAVEELGIRMKSAWIPAIALLVGMYAIHFATGKGYFVRPTKQQLREASQFVMQRSKGELPVYAVAWDQINFNYYFHLAGRIREVRSIPETEVSEKGLAATVPEAEFWIASAGLDINRLTDFRRDFDVVESGEFLMARAYHLRRKQP